MGVLSYFRKVITPKQEDDETAWGHILLVIGLVVKRKESFALVTRVIVISLLLGFTFHSDERDDNVALSVTILLTSKAYLSLVFAQDHIPKLGHLVPFIDVYLLAAFTFILL